MIFSNYRTKVGTADDGAYQRYQEFVPAEIRAALAL
jgi:hypothetical protein